MNIGEASNASGVSAKMIRYYEEIGLIRQVDRSTSGYRHYTDADVQALRFIRRARELGFPMVRIVALLSLWQNGGRSSAEVKALALDHIASLENKIAGMRGMIDTLRSLAERCDGNASPDCPIIDDLAAGSLLHRSVTPLAVTMRKTVSGRVRTKNRSSQVGQAR